ncbi:hypothetical protein Y032_0026g1370 [Ancylostoma ceylanicum]|uniref:Uncharacterized protein n=1 Tax=Ancylostoma ceylanicum TaxID=53326 RepID=A0A016UTN1_9BILA|nr:hypothetical protein Y032_0026g1370 [Ancylostoma ceylanicum]
MWYIFIMFNKNTNQRWASARCRSELELANVRERSAPPNPEFHADRLNLDDINAHMERRRSMFSDSNKPGCHRRSVSTNARRASLKEELRRLWVSRPSLLFFKPSTRVGNDDRLDSRPRSGEREDDELSDDACSLNSDVEMMPDFFIVDRSLVRQPLKSTRTFPFFRK